MTNNDRVLLDAAFDEWRSGLDAAVSEDRAFEIFACTQVLRDFDLSADEIERGVIGGHNDAAIDGAFVFLGDSLLAEDSDELSDDYAPGKLPKETQLSLHLIQAKRTPSFTETAIDKVASSTTRLLDLTLADEDLAKLYSSEVLDRIGLFRAALSKFASRYVKVGVHFHYVTRGERAAVNAKVELKSYELARQFSKVVIGAEGASTLVGATELWSLLSTLPSYTLQLTFEESATSGNSHVALVTLRNYMEFLQDENGALRRHIFDWNVRDYQGEVEVNKEIRKSVLEEDLPEFWWLNNGVTIVCSRTSIVSKTFSLDDVQVVNGLQTSQTIYHALRDSGPDHPALDRKVLVRILVTGDDTETRDQVIRATNRQTSVPAASLRATDDIQRKIEAFFLANDWYYDRRKNYYRNQGKPVARIVGIPLLAQSVMAMGLSQPDNSRARPSSLLKRDTDYSKVFDAGLSLSVYLWLARTQRAVDAFLLSEQAGVSGSQRTNLRFHLAMLAVAVLHGGRVFSPSQLKNLADDDTVVADELLVKCLHELRKAMANFAAGSGDSMDKVAKGPDFVSHLIDNTIPSLLLDSPSGEATTATE